MYRHQQTMEDNPYQLRKQSEQHRLRMLNRERIFQSKRSIIGPAPIPIQDEAATKEERELSIRMEEFLISQSAPLDTLNQLISALDEDETPEQSSDQQIQLMVGNLTGNKTPDLSYYSFGRLLAYLHIHTQSCLFLANNGLTTAIISQLPTADQKTQLRLAQTLQHILDYTQDNHQQFLNPQHLDPIVKMLESGPSQLVTLLMGVLALLVSGSISFRNHLSSSPTLRILLWHANHSHSSTKVVEYSCQVICQLCQNNSQDLSVQTEEIITTLTKAILSDRLRDSYTYSLCLQQLSFYCRKKYEHYICQSKVIDKVLRLSFEEMMDKSAVSSILQIVSVMIRANETYISHCYHHGILNVLHDCLDTNSNSIRALACRILNIISNSKQQEQVMAFLVQKTLFDRTMECLIDQRQLEQVKAEICQMLARLASKPYLPTIIPFVIKQHLLEVYLSILRSSMNARVTRSVLASLGQLIVASTFGTVEVCRSLLGRICELGGRQLMKELEVSEVLGSNFKQTVRNIGTKLMEYEYQLI